MKTSIVKALCIAAVAASLCGCTSVMGRSHGVFWGSPYSPTLTAYAYTEEVPILWADLPFDAALDTVLLPVDLVLYPFVNR